MPSSLQAYNSYQEIDIETIRNSWSFLGAAIKNKLAYSKSIALLKEQDEERLREQDPE